MLQGLNNWGADEPGHDPMTPWNGMRGPTYSSLQMKGWVGRVWAGVGETGLLGFL